VLVTVVDADVVLESVRSTAGRFGVVLLCSTLPGCQQAVELWDMFFIELIGLYGCGDRDPGEPTTAAELDTNRVLRHQFRLHRRRAAFR